MSAHLSHGKSHLVSFAQLQAMPAPKSLSPMHKPVAHSVLVEHLRAEAHSRGYDVVREAFALDARNVKVFGTMDLVLRGAPHDAESILSLGFRNSTNRELAIKGVAGRRVMVCDNMTMSGDMIAIMKKNTIGLDLAVALTAGFDKFLKHATTLDRAIMRLQSKAIADAEAKAMIYDAFNAGVVPVRLFGYVGSHYFHPREEMTDCAPRTVYGLYNAFTRAVKELNPVSAWRATIALGRQFGLRSEQVESSSDESA